MICKIYKQVLWSRFETFLLRLSGVLITSSTEITIVIKSGSGEATCRLKIRMWILLLFVSDGVFTFGHIILLFLFIFIFICVKKLAMRIIN